jgi:hypothetical protein
MLECCKLREEAHWHTLVHYAQLNVLCMREVINVLEINVLRVNVLKKMQQEAKYLNVSRIP